MLICDFIFLLIVETRNLIKCIRSLYNEVQCSLKFVKWHMKFPLALETLKNLLIFDLAIAANVGKRMANGRKIFKRRFNVHFS